MAPILRQLTEIVIASELIPMSIASHCSGEMKKTIVILLIKTVNTRLAIFMCFQTTSDRVKEDERK